MDVVSGQRSRSRPLNNMNFTLRLQCRSALRIATCYFWHYHHHLPPLQLLTITRLAYNMVGLSGKKPNSHYQRTTKMQLEKSQVIICVYDGNIGHRLYRQASTSTSIRFFLVMVENRLI